MHRFISLDHVGKNELLYHYTKCKSVQSILKTGVLYATRSSFLNDTNEMAYIIEVAKKMLKDVKNQDYVCLLDQQIVATMEDFARTDIFVISFSINPDDITLWAEFGESTGYNIAFDAKSLIRGINAHNSIYCHGHVIYDEKKQKDLIYHLLTEVIASKVGKPFETIMDEELRHPGSPDFKALSTKFRSLMGVYAMFFKQKEFAAEQEYRIVFKNPNKSQICFREQDGFLLPYIKIRISEGKLPIRGMTVAPKNHVDLARKGMEVYLDYLGYHVPIELSQLKLRY